MRLNFGQGGTFTGLEKTVPSHLVIFSSTALRIFLIFSMSVEDNRAHHPIEMFFPKKS